MCFGSDLDPITAGIEAGVIALSGRLLRIKIRSQDPVVRRQKSVSNLIAKPRSRKRPYQLRIYRLLAFCSTPSQAMCVSRSNKVSGRFLGLRQSDLIS